MITDVKKEIGQRLTTARKERLGITIKELALRTKTLSAQRISNWEQGTRSPGPVEAKLLGEHLNISPAYLLCLTDNPLGERIESQHKQNVSLSIFQLSQFPHPHKTHPDVEKLTVYKKQNPLLTENCIAFYVDDESMLPMFKPRDMIIIDSHRNYHPGNHIVCYHNQKKQVLLRQYKETEGAHYKLSAYNELWADITVTDNKAIDIIGVVIEHRSYLR